MISVFVSKDTPWTYFEAIARRKLATFTYRSCIRLELAGLDQPPQSDWIFFSSPSGVQLFLDHYTLPAGLKIAALASGTAAALRARKVNLHFQPASDDVEASVREFAARLGPSDTVLYPRSSASLLRLHSVLSPPRLIDWPFYHTLPNPPEEAVGSHCAYLVFTSPSNANAYLDAHPPGPAQRIVAIGESTAISLRARGISNILLSESPNPEGIWKCIADDAGLGV